MKNFLARLKNIERSTIIKNSFLLPILSVVVMSISHVISWYDLGNPFSWAIYLSIAVEIFALASVSAASIKIKKGSIWLLFILVTLIQIIGNVFFTFQDIDLNGSQFKSWIELVQPWFEDWTPLDHRRLLALIQGGTLPFMSLIALHFYNKFNENLGEETVKEEPKKPDAPIEPLLPEVENTEKPVDTIIEEKGEDPVIEESSKTALTHREMLETNNVSTDNEKKSDDDQIHISDKNRRRLHPARY